MIEPTTDRTTFDGLPKRIRIESHGPVMFKGKSVNADVLSVDVT